MISLYRTLSLRYFSERWVRALLIVLSIALGVGTLVATRALSETMNRAGLQASNPLAGTVDLLVSNGDNLVDMSLAEEVAGVEGVKSARPRIFKKVKLPGLEDRSALLIGVSFQAESESQGGADPAELPQFSFDNWLTGPLEFGRGDGVLAGKELAKLLPEGDGALRVVPQGSKKVAEVRKVGTIDAHGDAALLAGSTLIMDVAAAGRLLGYNSDGRTFVNRIDLVLADGASRESVKKEVHKILRGRAEVRTPEEQHEMVLNVFSGLQAGFSLSGAAALVVGLFLVYNALAVTVAERRHEIGILLSLGATRGQVRALFAGEAALLGLVGSLLGIPLGLGLAYAGLQPVQDVLRDIFMALDARQVEVSAGVVAFALVAGVVTAVLASSVPAFQASAENPAEAVRRIPPKHTWHFWALQVGISVTLVLAGSVLTLLHGSVLPRSGLFSGMMLGMSAVLIGLLAAMPIFSALISRAFRPLAGRALGIAGRLAADNLVRSPARTGLVIAALAAGVSLVLQTAGVIHSNRAALRDWIDEHIGADLFVTSGSPVGAGGRQEPMPEGLRADLQAVEGVRAAAAIRSQKVPFRNTQVFLMSLEPGRIYEADPGRSVNRLFRKLEERRDGVIISENFRAIHGVRVGDVIELTSPSGPVRLDVVGETVDYSWNHGTLIVSRRDFQRYWPDDKVDVYDLYLAAGADPLAVKERIARRLAAEHDLVVQTRSELKAHIDGMIERLYGVAQAQLVVVMLVASLGVVMALLISVLQRRREMGLLRAIGASQAQVVRSVLVEAALMGVIGTLIGLAVGIPMEWYVLNFVILEETGYLFPVYIPWTQALVIAGTALLLATLAGLGPALYAVRERIPEAIAYE